jgi:glycosyltransferase involved in cell wall biosynthesis|tara:strand:+ start:4779 stop:5708 length:930 start_codon:yes stop_codon:yes gene_type:complete
VIPSFRVTDHILEVLKNIGPEVERIYVIDDACPDKSGEFVKKNSTDKRVQVLFHETNQGVGGAVVTGYIAALADNADVVVKVDGDGQMDPGLILTIAKPVLEGNADYSKGNRFDSLEDLFSMPKARIFGNAVLSLWSKLSSGYWNITDPTNGFTAIHRKALEAIQLDKLRKTYFFESDLLFRLSIVNAVVMDVPMVSVYGNEKSNLKIRKVIFEFPWRHTVNLHKRIFYKYYLREWSVASFELPIGIGLTIFGAWFGLARYFEASGAGQATTAGQVTLSALALILGVQLLLSFLAYDVQSEPRVPRQKR